MKKYFGIDGIMNNHYLQLDWAKNEEDEGEDASKDQDNLTGWMLPGEPGPPGSWLIVN